MMDKNSIKACRQLFLIASEYYQPQKGKQAPTEDKQIAIINRTANALQVITNKTFLDCYDITHFVYDNFYMQRVEK